MAAGLGNPQGLCSRAHHLNNTRDLCCFSSSPSFFYHPAAAAAAASLCCFLCQLCRALIRTYLVLLPLLYSFVRRLINPAHSSSRVFPPPADYTPAPLWLVLSGVLKFSSRRSVDAAAARIFLCSVDFVDWESQSSRQRCMPLFF